MLKKNLGPDQPKGDEGWKEVTRKKEKKENPSKAAVSTSPSKEKTPSQEKHLDPTPVTLKSTPAAPEPAPETTTEPKSPSKSAASSPAPPLKVSKKMKMKPAAEPEETQLETIVNLKRKRNSGEGSSKKICPNTPLQQDPLEGTSSMVLQPPHYQPSKSCQQQPLLQQQSPSQTPSLPSLTLSSSSPELFPKNQSQSEVRLLSPTTDKPIRQRTKSVSPEMNKENFKTAVALCSVDPGAIGNFQIRKALKPLLDFENIKEKKKKECPIR